MQEMQKTHMTKLNIPEAIRLFTEGAFLTDREAAEHFGVVVSTIHEFHKEHGLRINKSGKAYLKRKMDKHFGEGTYDFFVSMRAKGATFDDIARAKFNGKKSRQKAHQWWKKIEQTK